MKNGIKALAVVMTLLLMSGCVGTPDKEGWRYGQKSEFIEILQNVYFAADVKPCATMFKPYMPSQA